MSLREHVSLREHACVSSRGAQSTELVWILDFKQILLLLLCYYVCFSNCITIISKNVFMCLVSLLNFFCFVGSLHLNNLDDILKFFTKIWAIFCSILCLTLPTCWTYTICPNVFWRKDSSFRLWHGFWIFSCLVRKTNMKFNKSNKSLPIIIETWFRGNIYIYIVLPL